MKNTYRGGNSRQLARHLDSITKPIAVIDRKGQVVFVNAALCEMTRADATQLVGKRTSWEIAADDTAHHAILTALALPAKTRAGNMAVRQFTAPLVFGSQATGQLFIPICDDAGSLQLALVLFGDYQDLQRYLPTENIFDAQSEAELAIIEIRSRWQTLDGLHLLLGNSPAIQLATQRTQLAAQTDASYLVCGPPHTGKSTISKAIFLHRLSRAGLSPAAGQYFSLDCGALPGSLLESMLEIFSGRLNRELPVAAQCLVLEQLEALNEETLALVEKWLDGPCYTQCVVCSLSNCDARSLAARGPAWRSVLSRLAVTEIEVPSLADRREDIGPLTIHFVAQQCRSIGREPLGITGDARELLTAFDWPGNVKQLQQVIVEAVQNAEDAQELDVSHLPIEIRTFVSSDTPVTNSEQATALNVGHMEPIDMDEILQDLEKMILERAIKLSPRNRAQVARWLGISRPRLLRRLRQLGIDEQQSDANSQCENDQGSMD